LGGEGLVEGFQHEGGKVVDDKGEVGGVGGGGIKGCFDLLIYNDIPKMNEN